MDKKKLPADLINTAKKHPNGYVYVLDIEFEGKEEVPPEFIKGAWKVDENGIIEGDFYLIRTIIKTKIYEMDFSFSWFSFINWFDAMVCF